MFTVYGLVRREIVCYGLSLQFSASVSFAKRLRFGTVEKIRHVCPILWFPFGGCSVGQVLPRGGLVCANTPFTSLTGHGSALWSGKEWVLRNVSGTGKNQVSPGQVGYTIL